MPRLSPFVPPLLWRALADRAEVPRSRHLDAALLSSDISGFTALTEALQARGREGAEEIAALVSAAFRPAIRAIEQWGGSVQSFGGDALFAVFPEPSAVCRACRAAHEIRQGFTRRGSVATSAGRVELRIAQAIHHGAIAALDLGRGERRHHMVCGRAVIELARLQTTAPVGDLVLSHPARARQAVEPRSRRSALGGRRPPDERVGPYLPAPLHGLLGRFEGEYRRVAVLFLETRGYARPGLATFFDALSHVLDRYEGLLLKSDLSTEGTKWVCLFGIPAAHEEDVERAARAALDIVGAPALLPVRGGLEAGTVVNVEIGSASRRSFDVMGDVVNTAARAVARAGWGEVLVTESARRSLPSVETLARGRHAVKGKRHPIDLHALVAARALATPLMVSAPLQGRGQELDRIRAALEAAREGKGAAIGIRGEAGIGKSRLKWEAAKIAGERGMRLLEGRAVPFGGAPYGLLAGPLRRLLGIGDDADGAAVRLAIAEAVRQKGLAGADGHHLADALGARVETSPLSHLDGRTIRLNNAIAIHSLIVASAACSPLLVALEDMHWADELSREAVSWLARGISAAPMVLLLLYRKGYAPPEATVELHLKELPPSAVDAMLKSLMGEVPEAVADMVRTRAEGNPLYIEELARHLTEMGLLSGGRDGRILRRAPAAHDLPARVESLIEARLDRLTPGARRVAQLAAVIGRSFPHDLLHRIARPQDDPQAGLRDLYAHEIAFPSADRPDGESIFKHALTRDVAYATILSERRRRLHRLVAWAIEAGGEDPARWALLGHHWEHAACPVRARDCYRKAAEHARERSAVLEAIRLYRSYLALSPRPTEQSGHARCELANLLRMAGSEEARSEWERAIAEARRGRRKTVLAHAQHGLGQWHALRGRLDLAQPLYEGALHLYRALADRIGESRTLVRMALQHRDRGDLAPAKAMLEEALARLTDADVSDRAVTIGNMSMVEFEAGNVEAAHLLLDQTLDLFRTCGNRVGEATALTNIAIYRLEAGRVRDAAPLYEQALALAREIGHRVLEGETLTNYANIHYDLGDLARARKVHAEALRIHRLVGSKGYEAIDVHGLALIAREEGDLREAEVLLRQALDLHRQVEDLRFEGQTLEVLADVTHRQGRFDEATALHEEAVAAHRAAGNPAGLGVALVDEAGRRRQRGCPPEEALALLAQAREILESSGCRRDIALLCEEGHCEILRGNSARPHLERALRIAEELGHAAGGPMRGRIARLARAISAFEDGIPLVRGELWEDLPDPLRPPFTASGRRP